MEKGAQQSTDCGSLWDPCESGLLKGCRIYRWLPPSLWQLSDLTFVDYLYLKWWGLKRAVELHVVGYLNQELQTKSRKGYFLLSWELACLGHADMVMLFQTCHIATNHHRWYSCSCVACPLASQLFILKGDAKKINCLPRTKLPSMWTICFQDGTVRKLACFETPGCPNWLMKW